MSSSSYHVRKKKAIELVKASTIGNITIKQKNKTIRVTSKILNLPSSVFSICKKFSNSRQV